MKNNNQTIVDLDHENVIHTNVIIDACASLKINFTCMSIMRHIAENETNEKTFDHHDIALYLDELVTKKFIKRSRQQTSEFTTYEMNLG